MKKIQTLFKDDLIDITLYEIEENVYSILHNVQWINWSPSFIMQDCSLDLQFKTIKKDYENPQDEAIYEIVLSVKKVHFKPYIAIRDDYYITVPTRIL